MSARPVAVLTAWILAVGFAQDKLLLLPAAGILLYAVTANANYTTDSVRFALFLTLGLTWLIFVSSVNLGSLMRTPGYFTTLGIPLLGSVLFILFAIKGNRQERAALLRAFVWLQVVLAVVYLLALRGLFTELAGQPVVLRPSGKLLGLLSGNHSTALQLAIAALLIGSELARRTRDRHRESSAAHGPLAMALRGASDGRLLLALVPLIAGLAATRSRGYVLAFVVASLFVAFAARRALSRPAALGLACMGIVGMVYGIWLELSPRFDSALQDDFSVTSRLGIWDRAVDMVAASPLTGYGVGGFQATNAASGATIIGNGAARFIEGGALPSPVIPGRPDGGCPPIMWCSRHWSTADSSGWCCLRRLRSYSSAERGASDPPSPHALYLSSWR